MNTEIAAALLEACQRAGSKVKLARRLGIVQSAISHWFHRGVPAARVAAIEEATGVPAHRLRPDVFRPPQLSQEQPHGTSTQA